MRPALWILLCLGSICVVPLVLCWQKRSKQNKCQPYYSENAENPTDRYIVVGGRLYSYGKLIFLLLSLLVLVVFGLYKGCVLFDAHGYNKFMATYDGVVVGHNLADVFNLLGTRPVYEGEMTDDNIGLIDQCGLKSLPPLDNYSEHRFAAFPWAGIPRRFIFVFYTKKESNVVAKAHCKM